VDLVFLGVLDLTQSLAFLACAWGKGAAPCRSPLPITAGLTISHPRPSCRPGRQDSRLAWLTTVPGPCSCSSC
jgi:hypothetical protein